MHFPRIVWFTLQTVQFMLQTNSLLNQTEIRDNLKTSLLIICLHNEHLLDEMGRVEQ